MFTLSDYGNFSIWHKEANLWLLDLTSGDLRELSEVNSDDTESFHNWSSNSRWFVFSSRRGDGLYTRLYLASMDENGKISKPFSFPRKIRKPITIALSIPIMSRISSMPYSAGHESIREEDNFKRAYTGSSWGLETKGYQKQYTDLIEKINNSIRSCIGYSSISRCSL